ncbi:MAG: 2-succinyl-5-enolpyruvyl-6-hydroxy-3-cyclohexene-1-carboxylic-acid synthase [Simkaniaceae bacterium]
MKQTAALNKLWSENIIQECVHNQIRYFCVGYGSRNTPLILAIANHPLAEAMLHFDERGIAFHALGFAKASQNPAAIAVTSGSAVGNLLPAVMEAYEDRVPLLILTADRPPELRDIGANQTTDQVKIFQPYVFWQMDFPAPDPRISLKYVRSTIAKAIFLAKQHSGPVHINFMFREPFFLPEDLQSEFQKFRSTETAAYWSRPQNSLDHGTGEKYAEDLLQHEEGIIVVGALPKDTSIEPILQLAKKKRWPIFADITSNIRSEGTSGEIIPHYDLLVKSSCMDKSLNPKAVLHLGGRLVSKSFLEWIAGLKPHIYLQIANHMKCIDPTCSVTHRLACDPAQFCNALCEDLLSSSGEYLQKWLSFSHQAAQKISAYLQDQKKLTEIQLPFSLATYLDRTTPVFFANSMPIRDADAFLFPAKKIGPIFANRGLSGIDGNIATAIGISKALKHSTIAILGDLAFLHDVNSLSQLKDSAYPIIFLVVNNHGGGIFSFLPIANSPDNVFERFFAGKHAFEFKEIASGFHLSYFKPNTVEALMIAIKTSQKNQKSAIIEIPTDRAENFRQHQDIIEIMKKIEPKKRSFLSLCYSALAKGT